MAVLWNLQGDTISTFPEITSLVLTNFYIADLNGDGKEEFVLFKSNTQTTRLYQSSGSSLSIEAEYFGSLPDGPAKQTINILLPTLTMTIRMTFMYLTGVNWGGIHADVKVKWNELDYVIRYDDHLPNWNMNNNDKYYVADINGDGKRRSVCFQYQ